MNPNKAVRLALCLLLVYGCANPYADRHVNYNYRDINGNRFDRIKVIPGPVRTVCIQPDPTQPEMALLVKPLEEKLAAKGYQITPTPEEAVHIMRLHINMFDKVVKQGSRQAPGVLSAAGTAVGGAVSGSTLHAAATTGGAVGGIAGLVLGGLLGAGSRPKGPLFFAEVDVRIIDPVTGEQHTARGKLWRLLKDYNDPEVKKTVQQTAAADLATQIAALMP